MRLRGVTIGGLNLFHTESGAMEQPDVIAAQGALPIMAGDDVIGAAGVSGAVTTPESPGGVKDEACVKAGIDKVAAELK